MVFLQLSSRAGVVQIETLAVLRLPIHSEVQLHLHTPASQSAVKPQTFACMYV